MKKIAFAALLLAAPLALTACGGSAAPLVIEPNWYNNTKLGDNIQGTYEKLVYTVGTDGERPVSRDGYSVFYTDGVYTTELSAKQISFGDTDRQWAYSLTADLSVTVRFSYGNTQKEYTEESHSSVQFLPVEQRLRPVSSFREVHCHTPTAYPTEQSLCEEYHYSYSIAYNADTTQADIIYKDLLATTEQTDHYELEGDTTYLDNEEIAFALRGVYSFTTFRTFNTSMGRVMEVGSRESKSNETKPISYMRNGVLSEKNIDTYQYQIGYGSGVGIAATLMYASKTSDIANEHRNVLLSMKLPILNSFGYLSYTLSEATFNDK